MNVVRCLDITQIKYFQMIIKKYNFSEAAAELNISQSSMSKKIAALETELNILLFDRTTRKVSITDAGKIFLNFANNILSDYYNVIEELKEFSIPTKGNLTIATIPVMAQYNITSLITGFTEKYPGINILIKETESESILTSMNNFECSLAFVRTNTLIAEKYDIIPFATDTMSVCVSKKHPFSKKSSIEFDEIQNEKLILLDNKSDIYKLCFLEFKNAGYKPNIRYTNTRIETIISLVASGEGITLLMDKVIRFFNNNDISIIPLKVPINSTIALVKPISRKLSPNDKLFWNYVNSVRLSNNNK